MNTQPIGSSLDDFLREEGCFEDMQALAIQEVTAWQKARAEPGRAVPEGAGTTPHLPVAAHTAQATLKPGP